MIGTKCCLYIVFCIDACVCLLCVLFPVLSGDWCCGGFVTTLNKTCWLKTEKTKSNKGEVEEKNTP